MKSLEKIAFGRVSLIVQAAALIAVGVWAAVDGQPGWQPVAGLSWCFGAFAAAVGLFDDSL